MYLKQLKLAGFKSFIDPVTIPLQRDLVAVVGPNGCGKSNIIDAVRWVMGESSAKSLRGESMSDVIFNGSSHRKPLGQASVELIFDNSMGALSGQSLSSQYHVYDEISVKRVVTRDGESFYYLNGTRCRRRDIVDIFLGTGAGTKGYSIIGQGTISRIIEARPEELRAYLEEAAGISKYKERRKETLQRITATRENMVRIADIREELGKQLQRLEQQAKTASRYQQLCEEERRLKSEILGLKWQQLEKDRHLLEEQHQQLQRLFLHHETQAISAHQQETEVRLRWEQENGSLQQLQAQFYQLTTDIARLEEQSMQQQREKQRLLAEQQQLELDRSQLVQQVADDRHAQTEHQELRLNWLTKFELANTELVNIQEQIQLLQQQESDWHSQLKTLQDQLQQVANDVLLATTHRTHHQARCQELKIRLETNLREQAEQAPAIDFDRAAQQHLQVGLESQLVDSEAQLLHITQLGKQLAEELQRVDEALDAKKELVYQLTTKHAALEAWLAQALGRVTTASGVLGSPWYAEERLIEAIDVEEGWRQVCERVLADVLQSYVVTSLSSCHDALQNQTLPSGVFVTAKSTRHLVERFPRLIDKIQGPCPDYVLNFDKIYAATDLQEALGWLNALADDESVVTPDGYWLGVGWLRIFDLSTVSETSLLQKQDELIRTREALQSAEQQLQKMLTNRDEIHQRMVENNRIIPDLQQVLLAHREELTRCVASIAHDQQRCEEARVKADYLCDEQSDLEQKLAELLMLLEDNEQQIATSQDVRAQLEQRHQTLNEQYVVFQASLKPYQQQCEETRTTVHEFLLQRDRAQLKVDQLTSSLLRDEARLVTFNERLIAVNNQLEQIAMPNESLQGLLTQKLCEIQEIEQLLNEKREQLNQLKEALEGFIQLNKQESAEATKTREKIQAIQLEEQTILVKINGVLESLGEQGFQLETVLQTISAEASLATQEQHVLSVIEKIKRLGAINLAAIDEFNVESERKNHLDEQYQDLHETLLMLESAIATMDKETEQRFLTMFNELNERFQLLFPRLFGGGHAVLKLTCDNLLEAGVMVMANPPGKRNSTIHLLSGGEKAMTAVALIFAIFQLNPSPFCMLDEVDAPLDDANVGRFCALMKEMSSLVQFLFITHNKVTMLLANQLIGVTMQEPGVSRIVAVDVEQAMLMSETE